MLRLRGRLAGGITSDGGEPGIDMAPLIDMVFILLIFFLVTTSFQRDAGVKVDRPQALTAQAQNKPSYVVAVDKQGQIFIDRRRVAVTSVRGLVERFLAQERNGAVVIVADAASFTGRVIEVLDQCRLAGARDVAVAANRPQ
ncbi:MAG: biopolymer transporter ExbD [Pseudomonadota bacterium]